MSKRSRKKTLVTIVPLPIEATAPIIRDLKRLVDTGLYGFTVEDAALRVLERGVTERLRPWQSIS